MATNDSNSSKASKILKEQATKVSPLVRVNKNNETEFRTKFDAKSGQYLYDPDPLKHLNASTRRMLFDTLCVPKTAVQRKKVFESSDKLKLICPAWLSYYFAASPSAILQDYCQNAIKKGIPLVPNMKIIDDPYEIEKVMQANEKLWCSIYPHRV